MTWLVAYLAIGAATFVLAARMSPPPKGAEFTSAGLVLFCWPLIGFMIAPVIIRSAVRAWKEVRKKENKMAKDLQAITDQIQNSCRHYRDPNQNEKCFAGVEYQAVFGLDELGETGCMLRLPCLKCNHTEENRLGEPLSQCGRLEWFTDEEASNWATALLEMERLVLEGTGHREPKGIFRDIRGEEP